MWVQLLSLSNDDLVVPSSSDKKDTGWHALSRLNNKEKCIPLFTLIVFFPLKPPFALFFKLAVLSHLSHFHSLEISENRFPIRLAINHVFLTISFLTKSFFFLFFFVLTGCRTYRPAQQAPSGVRWIDRPVVKASAVMAVSVVEAINASSDHLQPSTISSADGVCQTTISGLQPLRRPLHCTRPYLSWPVTSKLSTWRTEPSPACIIRLMANITVSKHDMRHATCSARWISSESNLVTGSCYNRYES